MLGALLLSWEVQNSNRARTLSAGRNIGRDTFPGGGRHWLPMLGAYNEHLARDVGALYLALAVLSAGAALRAADGYLTRSPVWCG